MEHPKPTRIELPICLNQSIEHRAECRMEIYVKRKEGANESFQLIDAEWENRWHRRPKQQQFPNSYGNFERNLHILYLSLASIE